MRRSVLLLTTSNMIGGMQTVVLGLSRQLSARGVDVRTVFPSDPPRDSLLPWARTQGVEAELTPALADAAHAHTWRGVLDLARYVRRSRADVVNLHYGDIFVSLKDVLAVRLARKRCIVSVYHPTPWSEAGEDKRRATRIAGSLAHAVIVESGATREVLLEAGISPSKTHTIACGLRPPETLPSRAEAREALGLPQDAFIVGALSRQLFHKGIVDLIDGFAMTPDPCHNMLLAIAGDGPERENFAAIANERLGKRAISLGRVRSADEFYAALDVFALPSYREGFGLVYVEAGFHGVPSIGGDSTGVREAILDGRTGLLVTPGDQPAIASAITRMHDDAGAREAMGAAARERAHAEFTDSVMADRYERVLWQS